MIRYLLALAALFGTPAYAVAPVVSVPDVVTVENAASASVAILKTKASSYTKVRVQTVDGSGRAGVDYKPVDVTLTIGNNTTRTLVPVTLIDNVTYQGERIFAVRLTVLRNGVVASNYEPARVTIADDEQPPAPTTGLAGEAAIADNFDVATAIEPYPLVPGQSGDAVGAFRMTCTAGHIARDDPIVYPGQPGASHLHQFWGNTGTNASSTYQSLRTTGDTTCGSGGPINRTAYWMPAMLNGAGGVVKPDNIQIYYKQVPAGSADCLRASKGCVGLPNGIRLVFGHNMKTMTGGPMDPGTMDYYTMHYQCWLDASGTQKGGNFQSIAAAVQGGCPAGALLVIQFSVPGCWDGKNLDSADHRSHLSYGTPETGGQICPSDHPYLISAWQGNVRFTTDANFVAGRWRLSSDDAMSEMMGAPVVAGSTLHFDYFEGWSPTIKARWQKNCVDGHLTCADGQLGDGTHIKTVAVPPSHQVVAVP